MIMKFVDSHCHLHDSRIQDCLPDMMKRALKSRVIHMASCATMENNFESTLKLSKDFHGILPFFGIHPWFIASRSNAWKQVLESYLTHVPSGVGETGIDFTDRSADRDLQVKIFSFHLALAKELQRPINIHIRKGWDAFIHIIKKFGPLPVPGMIHSYSGSADMIPIFEKHNLYISFSGSVTNPNGKKVAAALEKVSCDRYVLETDSPDIYPYIDNPDPSGLNEPANLPAIAKIAAKRIGERFETFGEKAYKNSLRLFEPVIEERKS